jgi:hypothetical protein
MAQDARLHFTNALLEHQLTFVDPSCLVGGSDVPAHEHTFFVPLPTRMHPHSQARNTDGGSRRPFLFQLEIFF